MTDTSANNADAGNGAVKTQTMDTTSTNASATPDAGQTGDTNKAGANSAATGDTGQTKTILDGAQADKQVTLPADFPADWREKIAAGDEKVKTQLDRFTSPTDMAKKILAQEATITRLTSQKGGLPKDATPEQVAEWRKVNDIPESPEKYNLNLPDGLVIGEQDMPIVRGIVKAMHGVNANQGQVQAAIAEYYRQEKAFLQEREGQISEFRTQQDDQLHQEFGGEYRANMNLCENFLHTMPQEFQDIVAGGFDQNGMPLRYNASFIKGLLDNARTINPIDIVVGAGAGSQMSAVSDEIAAIEKRMGEDRDGYFKDQKMQERYKQLLEWQSRNTKAA